MSAAAEKVSPMLPKLQMGQAYLSGLIAGRRRVTTSSGAVWLTVVRLPAADEFSHPATVEVRSKSSIGDVDERWQGIVSVNGFPRQYNSKPDPETGEIKLIRTAEVRLDVVES